MTEAELYFNFLLHVAAADGKVDKAELDFLDKTFQAVGVSNEIYEKVKNNIKKIQNGQKLDGLETLLEELSLHSNPFFLMNLIKDAYALAISNSEIDKRELAIIKRLLSCFTTNPENFIEEVISWAKQTISIENRGIELLAKMTSTEVR